MVLSRSNWKADTAAWRKQPRAVRLASLGGAVVILRPLSALRQTQLYKESEGVEGSGLTYGALLMAAVACEGEATESLDVVSVGDPIWTAAELLGDEFGHEAYRELSDKVAEFLKPAEDPAKNCTPATVSPTV